MASEGKDEGPCYEVKLIDGVHRTVAKRLIPMGETIEIDPGLFCLPTQVLQIGKSTESLIAQKLGRMSQEDQNKFYELSNPFEAKLGKIYGRCFTHLTEIRHTPEYSGIFPILSKVRNSCAPNCVAAVIQIEDDERKDWALVLRSIKSIPEGTEITRFAIKGGGDRATRQAYHTERFGCPCTCCACSLESTELEQSDTHRRELCYLRQELINEAKDSSSSPQRGH